MDSLVKIQTCGGLACKAGGIKGIFLQFAELLGVDEEKGGVSGDGKFELIRGVACQGKCGVGPVVVAWRGDEKYVFNRVDSAKVRKIVEAFR